MYASASRSEPFIWGSGTIRETRVLRDTYVAALQVADNHDFGPLMAFVRS